MTAGWRSILYTADAIENMHDSGHDLLIFMGTTVFSVIVFFKGKTNSFKLPVCVFV